MAKTGAKRAGAAAERTVERRKTQRSQGQSRASAKAASPAKAGVKAVDAGAPRVTPTRPRIVPPLPRQTAADECAQCSKRLGAQDRALFVEEELCRTFCSEDCIGDFFAPDIRRLEREYQKHVSASDLNSDEREKYAHLRWVTLEQPDEAWMERTVSGDHRYTLISEFRPGDKKIWMVCICLFLRGEPSFLFIAFPTSKLDLVKHFRRGERVRLEQASPGGPIREAKPTVEAPEEDTGEGTAKPEPMIDGLADGWSEDENIRAQLLQKRAADDIPPSEFESFQHCLEETLETPDEVWAMEMTDEGRMVEGVESRSEEMDAVETVKVFHFIRRYPNETPEMWYVIVARETETEDQIELLDAFPTRDPDLVQKHRRGMQEIGQADQAQATRVVH